MPVVYQVPYLILRNRYYFCEAKKERNGRMLLNANPYVFFSNINMIHLAVYICTGIYPRKYKDTPYVPVLTMTSEQACGTRYLVYRYAVAISHQVFIKKKNIFVVRQWHAAAFRRSTTVSVLEASLVSGFGWCTVAG